MAITYDIQDVYACKWKGDSIDQMNAFLTQWEGTLANLNNPALMEDGTLASFFLQQLENCNDLRSYTNAYHMAKFDPKPNKHTYEYLLQCFKDHLSRHQVNINRDRKNGAGPKAPETGAVGDAAAGQEEWAPPPRRRNRRGRRIV